MLLIIGGISVLGAVLPASTGFLMRIGYPLAALGAVIIGLGLGWWGYAIATEQRPIDVPVAA
jgi:hypothetical protein